MNNPNKPDEIKTTYRCKVTDNLITFFIHPHKNSALYEILRSEDGNRFVCVVRSSDSIIHFTDKKRRKAWYKVKVLLTKNRVRYSDEVFIDSTKKLSTYQKKDNFQKALKKAIDYLDEEDLKNAEEILELKKLTIRDRAVTVKPVRREKKNTKQTKKQEPQTFTQKLKDLLKRFTEWSLNS